MGHDYWCELTRIAALLLHSALCLPACWHMGPAGRCDHACASNSVASATLGDTREIFASDAQHKILEWGHGHIKTVSSRHALFWVGSGAVKSSNVWLAFHYCWIQISEFLKNWWTVACEVYVIICILDGALACQNMLLFFIAGRTRISLLRATKLQRFNHLQFWAK